MSERSSKPHDLWQQAGGDRNKYLDLMRQHGHIVPGRRPDGEDVFGHSEGPEPSGDEVIGLEVVRKHVDAMKRPPLNPNGTYNMASTWQHENLNTVVEERIERAEDWTPIERAYAEAMHEDCDDPPVGHPVDDHSPWFGGDLDGVPTWAEFTEQLARHGLTLVLDARSTSVAEDRLKPTAAGSTPATGHHGYPDHMPQSRNGCVMCNRRWTEHTPEEQGRYGSQRG